MATGLQTLHFKGWQTTPDVHNAGPCVCQNPTRIWRDCAAFSIRHCITETFPIQRIFNQGIDRRKEWPLPYKGKLRTRGNNTDNYTESMIFVFKCVVLRRMRAYNLIELFKFITEDLEMYFQRKLLSLAFGKPQNLHLVSRWCWRSASSVSQSTITIDEKNPSKFHVPSREDNNIIYTVDCTIGTCTCPKGTNGNVCPHQAAVALKFGISNINFVPQTAKERFNLAILAVGNNNNFSVIQFVSLHQKEIGSRPHFYKDQDKDHDEPQVILPSMPDDSQESISTETNDNCISSQTDANLPDAELSVDQLIKLHQQVSQDIEYKLRTINTKFRLCYYKYLTLYRRIISKCRGQAPVASLALPMHSLEKIGVEIICQSCMTTPELKYNQQLFPEGNLA